MSEKSKVIARAKSQVGYLEKKSNKKLDSFKANAGKNNYTKYNRDMKKIRKAGTLTDYWCANFLCDTFVKALGAKRAKAILGGFANYVPYIDKHFPKKYKTPKAGDIAIFHNQCHVGLVIKVSGNYCWTVEGNASNGKTNNGGAVVCKKYNYKNLGGWLDHFVRPAYKVTVADYPVLKKGSKNKYVLKAKKLLAKKGYKKLLNLKSYKYGNGATKATKLFQKKKGLPVTGKIDLATWKALLK